MTKFETEFIVSQHYKVIADESIIDSPGEALYRTRDEDRSRYHRMFQAITDNKEALVAIFEYKTIIEYGVHFDDCVEAMLKSNYGKKDDIFISILIQFIHIFTQEDREWIQQLVKEYKEVKAEDDQDEGQQDYFIDDYFNDFLECFRVEESCWDIEEHTCERKVYK